MDTEAKGPGFLIQAAGFVIVVAGIRAANPIIVPFLLAIFIAFICSVPLFWLQSKKIPKLLAISIIVFGIIISSMLMLSLLGSSLDKFSIALPSYQARLLEQTNGLVVWLRGKGVAISLERLFVYFDPGKIMQLTAKLFSGLGAMLTNSFLIVLTVVFIIFEVSAFPHKLKAAFGNIDAARANFDKLTGSIKYYLAIKTLTSLATGIFVAIWLAVLGVDFPVLWGLLAFFFNYVPNIGSIIAAVPALLLAFIQFGVVSLLLALLGYIGVNVIIGSVIEPRIMGRGVGLSTLVVFLSLVFWGWVLGPVGMLLSVPLTITLKMALENNPDTQWIGILLGTDEFKEAAIATPTKESP